MHAISENPEYDTDLLRFEYSSLATPRSTIDYDMKREVRKVQEIPSGYDAARFTSERIFATAPDGSPVPISVV